MILWRAHFSALMILGVGVAICAMYPMVGTIRWEYKSVPMDGARDALAMRLVRSTIFRRFFSYEAAEPPLGLIITPRYSVEGTTEKLDHSGKIFYGPSDPFVGFWCRVDPEADEGAVLDF